MRLAALSVFALGCLTSLHAQAVLGSGAVTGQIRDFANQGIPGTTVILTNDALDIRREMFTTIDGLFDAVDLIPAKGYVVKITRKGFKDAEVDNLEVIVGRTTAIRITLQQDNGRPVKAGPPLTQVDDTRQGNYDNVTPLQVDSLPSPDRRVDALAAMSTAVAEAPRTGVLIPAAEPFSNATWLDGIYTSRTHWPLQPRIEPDLPLDSVSELQVITAAPPVEFSHTMGATINIVSLLQPTDASKPARLHGSIWDYYNDNSFNATARFAAGFRPHGHQHEPGANAGGSLLHNHMYWFTSFEAINGNSQGVNRLTNPLLANAPGTAISTAGCAATAAQCNAAANFLNAQLNKVVSRSLFSLDGLGKLDYHLTEDQTFNFEAGAQHTNAPNGADARTVSTNGGLLGGNATYTDESRLAKVTWNSQFGGSIHNQARLTWERDRFSAFSNPALLPLTGGLGLTIAGSQFGGNPAYPLTYSQQNRGFTDGFMISAGANTVKLGVEYLRSEDWSFQVFNGLGSYDYPSLTSFALDFSGNAAQRKNYNLFTQEFGNPLVDLHIAEYIGYVQDTWKVTSRLTVNAGVHYERWRIPNPTVSNLTFFQTSAIPSSNKDAGPRVGISYLVNNKTVVRIAAGEYYQPYPGAYLDGLFVGNGFYQTSLSINAAQTGAGAPVYPRIVSPINIPSGGQNVAYEIPKARNPYTEQGTIGIERSLTRTTSLSLGYVYIRGKALWTQTDFNLNAPSVNQTYSIQNSSGAVTGLFTTPLYTSRGVAGYAHAYQVQNDGSSKYGAATLQITQKLFHGLSGSATYTRSNANSNVNGPPLQALGYAVPAVTYVGDNGAEQGPSSYWQRNRAVVNWTWQTPTTGKSRMMTSIAGGWQLSGIAVFASGLPESPLIIASGQEFSGVSMSYVNTINGSGGWSRVPFLGVNSLRTQSERVVSARLSRTFAATERVRVKLMFEGFNVFNSQYTTSVNQVAFVAQGGVLRPAPGLGVGNAADGAPFGDNARHLQAAIKITF